MSNPVWCRCFVMIILLSGCLLFHATQSHVVCPLASTIAPCICSNQSVGLGVVCDNMNLTDSALSDILNALLSPEVSPLVSFSASNNNLVKIPLQMSKFTNLSNVHFNNNHITTLPIGSFNFLNVGSVTLGLHKNHISSIALGALYFNPYPTAISINLSENRLGQIYPHTFDFLSMSTSIDLNLRGNRLMSVPSSAFYFSAYRIHVDMRDNSISTISQYAFYFGPSVVDIYIFLDDNNINKIPPATFSFTSSAVSVEIGLSNNQMVEIPSSAFKFTPNSYSINLDFGYNKIETIAAPKTFNFIPPSENFNLGLNGNKMTTFSSSVFEPLLNRMQQSTFYRIDITENPIDCFSDPCHLEWLIISDNRQLLDHVYNGTCSNGTALEELNSFSYSNCSVILHQADVNTMANFATQPTHVLWAYILLQSAVFFESHIINYYFFNL